MTPEQYEKTLSLWSAEEKEKAVEAKRSGDERAHSIQLMKASMLGDMLKVLGRLELMGSQSGRLAKEIENMEQEAARLEALGDYDAAERSLIKAETIRRAQRLIDGEGNAR